MTRYGKWLSKAATLLVFAALWQWASSFYSPEQLPGPLQVVGGLHELMESGILYEHIQISLLRFWGSYILAVVIAVPLGLILGWYDWSWSAVDPLIQILRPISPIAWFPLAVLWFGIGNPPAVFIIFLSAFFPVLLSSVSAVRTVDSLYLRVSENFGVSKWGLFTKVIIPAAFPQIMIGLHIAVGTAWIHLVAGEMLGAQSGLGYLIVDSRNFLRTDWIIGGMLVVGLLGLAINWLMSIAEKVINRRWGLE